jgi:hypothetical protein
MASGDMDIEITLAWWAQPYINVLAFVCAMTGTEPDLDKVEHMVQRGIKLRAVFD